MKTQIKRFLLTLGFMTRIPVNVDLGEVKDEDMHKGFLLSGSRSDSRTL